MHRGSLCDDHRDPGEDLAQIVSDQRLASLWFLAAFIVYQCYRYMYTHSIWLVLLTILDVIVAFLIWHEYQSRKQMSAAAHLN